MGSNPTPSSSCRMDTWSSGLWHTLGKREIGKLVRRFESFRIREKIGADLKLVKGRPAKAVR